MFLLAGCGYVRGGEGEVRGGEEEGSGEGDDGETHVGWFGLVGLVGGEVEVEDVDGDVDEMMR